jgi:hypothetical protein
MKPSKYILGIIIAFLAGCVEKWDDHYGMLPETVNRNVWEVIQSDPDLSIFAGYVREMKYDTLFTSNNTFTLFVPKNQAFEKMAENSSFTASILDYHISKHFVQAGNVTGTRKLQTLAEKFALFNNTGESLFFDDIPIVFESPLYLNGKYFTLEEIGYPRPNLYEYFAINNPVLKLYIDSRDSIILDLERSIPVGFDEEGNTIYDTVAILYNEFEESFFPVRRELRNRTATLVFPRTEEYNAALTQMAQFIDAYDDYSDIPLAWQHDILVPHLLKKGVFEGMKEEIIFLTPTKLDTVKMKNILGDSVVIDYKVGEKTFCSNGYAYSYSNFQIPEKLYKDPVNFEGEHLLRETGINRFAFIESVKVFSDVPISPGRSFHGQASNDSLLSILFPPAYTGKYSLEFVIDNLLPRKYLMVVGTNMYIGGIYDIYVNDELVRTMNWGEYLVQQGLIWSVTRTRRYVPRGTLNDFDALVDNRAEYGKTRIRFEYREPGNVSNRGLVIDNIVFIPYDF